MTGVLFWWEKWTVDLVLKEKFPLIFQLAIPKWETFKELAFQ